MKIMLLGVDGQVGRELSNKLSPLGELVVLRRDECDLSQIASIPNVIQEIQPDVIVNAAAYTSVDKAESEEAVAMRINGEAVGVLAQEAGRNNILLVHYSTDYVFDGTKSSPYTENDDPNPINAYGRSKLAGEEAIRDSGCSHFIIRTSWIHSNRGANFIHSILRLASERDELKIVVDQIGAPTSARLIADGTFTLLQTNDRSIQQTYHLTASGETNWFEYAKWILHEAIDRGIEEGVQLDRIVPIPTSEYQTDAKRPLNSRLDTEKLRKTFGFQLPDWKCGVSESVEGIIHCQC